MDKLFMKLFSMLYFINISMPIAVTISSNKMLEEKKRPHIVIILADDMGWDDVSFHGSDQIPTPNIDALAYNGIILNNHYVSALCTPSRSALMTGKHPIRLGMQHGNLLPPEPRGLPLNEKLLPQYLKEVGYKTHIIGKWNLGFYKREYTPTYRGFDTHFGFWNNHQDYYNHNTQLFSIPYFATDMGFDMRRNLSIAWDTIGKYSTDLFTKETVRLINAHDTNDAMFLYLAYNAPHSGNKNQLFQAPAEEIAKFSYISDPERRIYAAMVSKLDQGVGEVTEALKNRGMLENSIILFMTDNGAPTTGYLYNRGSNYPLSGLKNSAWEGGVRGVAAIWSSLIEKRKRVSNQLIHMTDWLPTLLSAAGIDKRRILDLDGYDMWPTLVSDSINQRSEVLINIDDITGYMAIRRNNFKYMKGKLKNHFISIEDSERSALEQRPPYDPEKVLRSKAGVAIAQITEQIIKREKRKENGITEEHLREGILTFQKILHLRQQTEVYCNVTIEERISCNPLISPCLFDLEKDPCEMINIIEQYPTIVASLEKTLTQHRLNMVPPSNTYWDYRANPILWNNTWTCWLDPENHHSFDIL